MQIADILKSLLRRWYLVVLTLVLTAGASYAVYAKVPPTYQQTASFVLVPGPSSVVEGANPLLYLGGLTYQRDLLLRSIQSGSVRDPLLESHPGSDFTADPDYATQSPVVLLTAVGPTPASTTAMLDAVEAAAQVELDRIQEQVNAPKDTLSGIVQVGKDPAPTTVSDRRLKLTALTGGAIAVLGVLLTVFVDARLVARRRESVLRSAGDDGDDGDDPAERDSAVQPVLLSIRPATTSQPPRRTRTAVSTSIVVPAHGRPRRARRSAGRV